MTARGRARPTTSGSAGPRFGRLRTRIQVFTLWMGIALAVGAVPVRGDTRSPWTRHEPVPEPHHPEVTVSVDWLARRVDARDVVVIDCRTSSAYGAGHIPGAISFPPASVTSISSFPDIQLLPEVFGNLGLSGRERLVCCGDVSSSESAALVFWLLELSGAKGALLLDGGVTGWRASGRELSTELTELPAVTWRPAPDPGLLATREYVRRSYGIAGVEIVDARGDEAWRGPILREDWGERLRVGHIPHSLPFDFTSFFVPDGTLRTPSETWSAFEKLGPRPSNPVYLLDEFVVYGWGRVGGAEARHQDTGESATGDEEWGQGPLAYVLLRRAGVERVRLYPGGWADWSGDPYLPVVRVIGADELMERVRSSRRWLHTDAPPADFAFFDVRHPADYRRGHIRGSVSLRSDYFADSLDVRLERYWPDIDRARAPIVTYCYGDDCIRSRGTSTDAARSGFVYIERFFGGLDEWRYAGGKLVGAE